MTWLPSLQRKPTHQLLGYEAPLDYHLVRDKRFKSVIWFQTGITCLLGDLEHTLPSPGENTSLRLSRWGNIQRAKHYEDSWLSLAPSPSLQVMYVRGGGTGWRKELEMVRNQIGPEHQAVLNIGPTCRRANSSCPGSKVLMGAWALYHMPKRWPHADFCWGSWNRPGSLATVIWVTAQQHLGVNKITCSAAT